MGTGPLLLERSAPHVKTVGTRNPDDRHTGQPLVDGVAWVVDANPRPGWRWPAPGNAIAAPWHGVPAPTRPGGPHEAPPDVHVMDLVLAKSKTHILGVFAERGIADLRLPLCES
jgi:hypothetical protein